MHMTFAIIHVLSGILARGFCVGLMASILESEAAFKTKALEHGLTVAQHARLVAEGITNLSKLAFAITTPGTPPPDDSLKGLLADDIATVNVGSLSSIRRLTFDAQTLSAAQVKHALAGTDAGRKAELVPAERAQRILDQKTKMAGMDLTGPLECSHTSYDYVAKMLEANVPTYLEPHRFTTRASEVSKERPGREVVLDHTLLTVKDAERKDKCTIQTDLQLSQALTRRALACDLMKACTFRTMERWHRFLLDQMQLTAPPHFKPPSMEQVLRADRAAWVRMAEQVPSLKRAADGSLPLDKAIDDLRTDPTVIFNLMPLPGGNVKGTNESPTKAKPSKPVHKDVPVAKRPPKGKGKGKRGKGKMPVELLGLNQHTASGSRICYNFNLPRGCTATDCQRGSHVCMKCYGGHSYQDCPSKQ